MYERMDVSVMNYMFESYGYCFPCDGDKKRVGFIDAKAVDAAEYEEYERRLKEWN